MNNMLSLEIFKIADKKIGEYKNIILGHEPIIEKDDSFLRGIFAVNVGTEIFKEFLNLDSATAEEFEETKDIALRVMRHKLNELKALSFKEPCKIVKVDFKKSGGEK